MTSKTNPNRRQQSKARRLYWLTPKVWNKSCTHCGKDGSVAVRPVDHRYACESCIERLGIKARESKVWRDGGSRAGAAVVIRSVQPTGRDPSRGRRRGGLTV